LAVALLRNVTETTRPRFDLPGFVTSTIGFGALLYGFSEAGNKGWGNSTVLTSIVVGVLALAAFIVCELASDHPVLELRVFRYSMFSLTTVVSCVINMAMFGAMVLLPIYVQNLRGYTPLQSGLLMMPGAILMGIMSPITGALFDRIGARPLVLVGLLITIVTTYQFAQLTPSTPYRHLMFLYALRMFGMSFIMMTVMTAGLNQLPHRLNAHGTAAANTARTVAGSLGTAILVSISSTRTPLHQMRYADWMDVTNLAFFGSLQQWANSLAGQLAMPLQAAQSVLVSLLSGLVTMQATIDSINDAFLVATGVTVVAFILAFFIRRVQPAQDSPSAAPSEQTASTPQPSPSVVR
ncbi:MAG: DHA2 family efflux MFS transporter permease subunit, partial [Alicyclobacillus sp.]|nr:DHA2 family efflux MFS transporter permease subunit [Alicyclobacillus sp.]